MACRGRSGAPCVFGKALRLYRAAATAALVHGARGRRVGGEDRSLKHCGLFAAIGFPRVLGGNSQAQVRVFVPTYRRPKLLPRALDSLLAQTFTEWECEVHNDDPN